MSDDWPLALKEYVGASFSICRNDNDRALTNAKLRALIMRVGTEGRLYSHGWAAEKAPVVREAPAQSSGAYYDASQQQLPHPSSGSKYGSSHVDMSKYGSSHVDMSKYGSSHVDMSKYGSSHVDMSKYGSAYAPPQINTQSSGGSGSNKSSPRGRDRGVIHSGGFSDNSRKKKTGERSAYCGAEVERDSSRGEAAEGPPMIGTCEDMCPADERESRIEERLVEPFEREHPEVEGSPRELMVKEFKRSSADYLLAVPHRIRTPATLLRTIKYIEDNIMEKNKQGVDPRFGGVPTSIAVYLFIWDRYRMIAKDFILQELALPVDTVYVECHERMARWFILMDHTMQRDDKFNDGHLQQNRESTNKLFKTLLECYKDAKLAHVPMPNKAEFIAYYLLEQMGNGGEVAKLMRQLSFDVRSSEKIRFVAEVWAAWKMRDTSRFFRLLRKADACQASLMHRYVGEVRVEGIRRMVRTHSAKGSGSHCPVRHLVELFMFEDTDDALAFAAHCGIAVESAMWRGFDGDSSSDAEELCAVFADQKVQELLPKDKNGSSIQPRAAHMLKGIDSKYAHLSLGAVCRGAFNSPPDT